MIRKTISDAISNIGTRHIEEAADFAVTKKSHKPVWLKWGTIAACFALVLAIGIPYVSDIIGPKGGPGQTDVLRPLNVIEYNGAYYEVLDMADTHLLDTYNLPHEITTAMIGTELGAGLDEQGNQTEEIFYLFTPYAEIATEERNGDERAQRAVYVTSENETYSFALFCNFIKYDTNTYEEITEMFSVYGVDAAEDIVSVDIGGNILDTASEIEVFFNMLCSGKGMGNDDYQKAVYGGKNETEQQALNKELANSMVAIKITTTEGMVINNLNYCPTTNYVHWGINYYKMSISLFDEQQS